MSDYFGLDDPSFIGAIYWENGPPQLSAYLELAPFVYYIQSGPLFKIGTSISPEKRVDQLRRGGKAKRPSVGLLEAPRLIAYHQGSANLERALHHRFKHLRDQGEWFWLDAELAQHIHGKQEAQCAQEVRHNRAREVAHFAKRGWAAIDRDLDAIYREHLAAKEQLDLTHTSLQEIPA